MAPDHVRRRDRGTAASARLAELAASPPRSSRAPAQSQRADGAGLPSGETFLGNISEDTKARLVAASRVSRVPAGRVIFRKGDASDSSCYLILDGAVKVSVPSKDGQETVLAILGQGEVVGEMALLDHLPRSATVTALKSCELCKLTTSTLDWLAREDSAIFRQLLRVLSTRVRASNETSQVQQLPLKARLARTLLGLADGFGQQLPDGRILIRQKVSQAELGRMVGAARENINRQLTDWGKAKVLTRVSAYYCIESRSTLESLAEFDTA